MQKVKTQRIFDIDSHIFTFTAKVISCSPTKNGKYQVVLDKTAFFPEGAGQNADVGTLGTIMVEDVQEQDGTIYHLLPTPLAEGVTINGNIDREVRFRSMQNHTGEHIVSGLINKYYGFNNVGFHLGHEDVTLDIDGYLDRSTLDFIETEANRAVVSAIPVKAYYPTDEELSSLEYRSKIDITENIRIVEIPGYDRCACCAPHVANTGEIGIIKLLDAIRYKGGMRIHMLCGFDVLEDYRARYISTNLIANEMSVKHSDVVDSFFKLLADLDKKKQEIAVLNQKLIDIKVESIPNDAINICLFEDSMDALNMRRLLNKASLKCKKLCGVFCGNDRDGYTYVIGKGNDLPDVKIISKELMDAIGAHGGGSSEMLQGRAGADRATIEKFFAKLE